MSDNPSFQFSHVICRKPSHSISNGLRAINLGDPDFDTFVRQHEQYVDALRNAGCSVTLLDSLEPYPDSVFIEDAALCLGETAIVLRPGAPSRFGEAAALQPSLLPLFKNVINLPGNGYVDGGDILVTNHDVFMGLSARTNQMGVDALTNIVLALGYTPRMINTPESILHFKTDCGLLDGQTVFSTSALASTGCFDGYEVIQAPEGEEAAANLIRVNDHVIIAEGFPNTKRLLEERGYIVECLPVSEAAKVDGGLSCMSLRYSST